MTILYYSNQQHERAERYLAKRFKNAQPVTRIQSCHSFVVNLDKELEVKRYSEANDYVTIMHYDNKRTSAKR